MLKHISKYNFYSRSQFVQLRGKYTAQCTHCALGQQNLRKCPVPMSRFDVFFGYLPMYISFGTGLMAVQFQVFSQNQTCRDLTVFAMPFFIGWILNSSVKS